MLAFLSQKRINLILSQQLNTTLFRTFKFWAAVGDAFYYYKTDYTKKYKFAQLHILVEHTVIFLSPWC